MYREIIMSLFLVIVNIGRPTKATRDSLARRQIFQVFTSHLQTTEIRNYFLQGKICVIVLVFTFYTCRCVFYKVFNISFQWSFGTATLLFLQVLTFFAAP